MKNPPSPSKKKLRKPTSSISEDDEAEPRDFPVVGIGASAGGLEAIKELLEALPENTGFTYVVIQHLASDQESMLPEILSRFTKMSVNKVHNGMQIEPDHVYVIPSGKIMTITKGTLKLQPKRTSIKPINDFLISLAQDLKTHAIGVILSGTGNDGTDGLKSIKAEGGITFVQDPKTATYQDMPRSAISAETAYYILSPTEIAKELNNIANHPEIAGKKTESLKDEEEYSNNLQKVFNLLKVAFRVNFANYKKPTINRRLSRRMVLNKIENKKEYVEYLQTHKNELQALFEDLLISVTGFFREPEAFNLLKESVFPELIKNMPSNEPLRVWVPGCSTGEEVYSIGIAIEEFLEDKNIVEKQVQIFGTDINNKNIEKARQAVYPKTIEEKVSEKRLKRFFLHNNGNYQVTKQIRDMCVFAKHDLTLDPPFSNLDLIFCRNLLIYFNTKLQERIIPILHYGLKNNGFLVLGQSESVGKFNYLFKPITKKGLIFKKKEAQPRVEFPLEKTTPYSNRKMLEQPTKLDTLNLLQKEVDDLLLSEYVPASFILNDNLDVIVFRGDVDPYISVASGVASFNISKIVRKELRSTLQTALYRVKKGKKEVNEKVRIEQDKQTKTVLMQIKPIKLPKHEENYLLVVFKEILKTPVYKKKAPTEKESESGKDQKIRELSEDLASTKQTLQTVIEQNEAINEELRSTFEEAQSSNEELMSTNEELETTKEELQSANEELTTLNDELKDRNQRLNELNDDLANLMDNVDTAVVLVDNDFKIKRSTDSAQKLLRLMPADFNHQITDLRLGIPIKELEKWLFNVTNKLEIVRNEIETERGYWYQIRIRPYLTSNKKVGGAVISLADITEMKELEDEKKYYTENLEQQVKDQTRKLVESESLAAIGKTAGMVGHDIRNPLQAIEGELYLARQELDVLPNSEARNNLRESIDTIQERLIYINKIIVDLQDYARAPAPNLKIVDLKKLVKTVVSEVPVPEIVNVSISIESDFPKLKADEVFLERILLNLIMNSLQAMPKGGNLTIKAVHEDNEAAISVIDTGTGISDDAKKNLFAPLFTTKSKGQGFGLAVVKKLTEAMDGTISFEGESHASAGKGAKYE